MEHENTDRELKNSSYELFILLVSILSMFNLMFLLVPSFSPVVKGVVRIMDAFITLLFMGDFLFRFFTASRNENTSSEIGDGPTCWLRCPCSS